MGDIYTDPSLPTGQVNVTTYTVNPGAERHWYDPTTWRNGKFLLQKIALNKFQDDEVPSQAKRRTEKHSMGLEKKYSKDGLCWTEGEFETSTYIKRHFIKKQWVEYWSIDMTVKDYYAALDSFLPTATDVVSTAAKGTAQATGQGLPAGMLPTTIGTAAAVVVAAPQITTMGVGLSTAGAATLASGGASAGIGMGTVITATGTQLAGTGLTALGTAAGEVGSLVTAAAPVALPVAAVAATAIASFAVGTEIAKKLGGDGAEKISEGWELVSTFDTPEELERTAITWGQVTPPAPCPEPKKLYLTTPLFRMNWTNWLVQWWWILVGAVAVALVAMGGFLFLGGGGGKATTLSEGGTNAVAPAAASPAAAGNGAPVVSDLRKVFVQPVTTWSISAKDPAGGPLTYVWQLTPDAPNEACGTPHAPWTQKGAQASWSHSNEAPDYCMHLTTDHVVTVTVTVTNQQGISVTCMIKGTESEDVPNPPCK